ncbi:hypothetical protein GSI_06935 [Ganoderma sinense ZZ0214-1]|uniref:Uncharacterized protein n=1 Tax=Ganoderma sinense ZZ0214-1 TaxID=1077348 RepID=A0A2G8SAI2_9APHY|nr:hypothetical protein GSI_06935 [Ganoderma sinense ZZ0214-1]
MASTSSSAIPPSPQPSESASSTDPQLQELQAEEHNVDFDPAEKLPLTDLLPNEQLPPWLNPMFTDVASPRLLPRCWFGIPFSRNAMVRYAINFGLDRPYTNGPRKGEVDMGRTWVTVCNDFREATGMAIALRDVLDCDGLILAFFSNWEAKSVTTKMLNQCMWLLREMGHDDDDRPLWYLDRDFL